MCRVDLLPRAAGAEGGAVRDAGGAGRLARHGAARVGRARGRAARLAHQRQARAQRRAARGTLDKPFYLFITHHALWRIGGLNT